MSRGVKGYGIKKCFQLLNLPLNLSFENPTHWGLETALCPIFAKPAFDTFAVSSLVPKTNLSHTQQKSLCPKNQNYLIRKADFRISLSVG